MPEKLYSNPLTYWKDGSTPIGIKVPIIKNGKPFCVRISMRSWLPVNYLVFANDKKQALSIVETSLRKCISLAKKRDIVKHWEELIKKGRREVQEIKPDQVFKIGWGLDTLS